MDLLFIVRTLARRGLLSPGSPNRVADQLNTLRRWGFTLAGELRAAEARDPHRTAVIDEQRGGDLLPPAAAPLPAAGRRARRHPRRRRPAYRVGLLCRNHAGLIEAMVACSLLGADAVLVNTALSAPQLTAVAEQQQLRLLLHDREFAPIAAAVPCERLDESRVDDADRADPAAGPLVRGQPGRPHHRAHLRHHRRAQGRPPAHPAGLRAAGLASSTASRCAWASACMIAAPLFHTWGYAALQLALAMRATVVLQRRFDPAATAHADRRARVHRAVRRTGDAAAAGRGGAVPASARRASSRSAASALPGGLATRFMDTWGDCLYNLYGSTEASWASIATPADLRLRPRHRGPPAARHPGRDPRPDRPPVPRGEVGEIHVGNEMLFEGYTRGHGATLPPATCATACSAPATWATSTPTGLLYVDGRADDMVVSGGENVFPRPVEELLAQLPQVREVAVDRRPRRRVRPAPGRLPGAAPRPAPRRRRGPRVRPPLPGPLQRPPRRPLPPRTPPHRHRQSHPPPPPPV